MLGLVCGLLTVVYSLSYSRLALPAGDPEAVATALSLGLLASAALCLVIALRFEQPSALGVIPPEITLLVGALLGPVVEVVPAAQRLPTSMMGTTLVALAAGAMMLLLGRWRLGRFAQLVPFPVVAGLVGGVGVLLLASAVDTFKPGIVTDMLRLDADPAIIAQLGLAVVVTGVILTAQAVRPTAANLPLVLGIGLAGFWAVMHAAGIDLEASEARWTLRTDALARPSTPITWWADPAGVAWPELVDSLPGLATLPALLVLVALIDTSTVELGTRRHLDHDRSLRVLGQANLAAGLAGGFPGTLSISGSILPARLGVSSRLVGLVAAGVCFLAWAAGASALAAVPTFLVAAVTLFVGIELVRDWVVTPARRLGRAEGAVLLLVVVAVVWQGFAVGFAVGLSLGMMLFVVSYGRLPIVRHATTLATRRSTVDRSEADRAKLRDGGDQVQVLELEGFLFFGSAARLYERIRRRLESNGIQLRFLVLDFRRVGGIDGAATRNLHKIVELARMHRFTLVATAVGPGLQRRLFDGLAVVESELRVEADLDHGLEWVEERLLADARDAPDGVTDVAALAVLGAAAGQVARHLELRHLDPGAVLIRQGERAEDLFIIRSGRVGIYYETEDGRQLRLRAAVGGAMVGEMAYILAQPRSASVIAETPATAWCLSGEALARIDHDEPQLMIAVQQAILRHLAVRLGDTTRLLGELQR